jgi:PKD repeat protein
MIALLRIAILILSFVFATSAFAQSTVTLMQGQNGYTGTTDSWIVCCSAASLNKGSDMALSIRGETSNTGLIRFSIFQSEGGPVPSGVTITSATLSLYKFGGPDGVMKASRILKQWNEAGVTWNSTTSTSAWTTPGALGVGTDVLATADGQGSVGDADANNCGSSGAEACWLHIDVTPGVRAFATGTPNFGWKIAQVSSSLPNNNKNFTSRDNSGFPFLRPKLLITWAPPNSGPTATFTATPVSGAAPLAVTFNASGSTPGSAPITSLRLQFGDATELTFNDKNHQQAHTYSAVGTYTATLTVTDSNAASSTSSRTITVSPPGSDILPSTPPAGNLGFSLPTFHSMSLYYAPASAPSGGRVWMRYRKASDSNTAWREGYPLWFDARTTGTLGTLPFTANGRPYPARGSAVHLQPGTKYYFELGVGADFASAQWLHHVAGTTWLATFPENTSVTTIPSQTGVYVIPASGGGTASAYKVYDGWNGTSKNVVNRGGAGTGNASAINDDTSHAIVVRASHVILRRVRATGAAVAGIYIAPDVTDVVIEDSQIDDWSWRPGITSDNEPSNPNSWGTWGFNEAGGIHLGGNNSRIVVQRNVIQAPHFGSFPWDTGVECNPFSRPAQVPNNHPAGPMGIKIQDAGRQNVIRYNEITGHPTNRNSWYQDGIGGGENFSDRGVPGADSDIYQNIIMHVFDDAIEAEGGGRNVRVWENYISDAKTAVATTTVHFGPTYVWRNVANRMRRCYQQVADANPAADWPTNVFKYGGFDGGYGDGIRYLFSNTILQQSGAFGAGYGVEPTSNGLGSVRWTIARNNILHVRDESSPSWSVESGDSPVGTDFAFNLYNGNYDTHLPAPDPAFRFTASQLIYRAGHGASSVPALGGGGAGNYQLDAGSKGLDICARLPNFTDSFSGSGPDCGAHESDAPPMLFGITAN